MLDKAIYRLTGQILDGFTLRSLTLWANVYSLIERVKAFVADAVIHSIFDTKMNLVSVHAWQEAWRSPIWSRMHLTQLFRKLTEQLFQTITLLFEHLTFGDDLLFFGVRHFSDSLPESIFLFLNDSNLLMVIRNLLHLPPLLLGFFNDFKYKPIGLYELAFIVELVFDVFSLQLDQLLKILVHDLLLCWWQGLLLEVLLLLLRLHQRFFHLLDLFQFSNVIAVFTLYKHFRIFLLGIFVSNFGRIELWLLLRWFLLAHPLIVHFLVGIVFRFVLRGWLLLLFFLYFAFFGHRLISFPGLLVSLQGFLLHELFFDALHRWLELLKSFLNFIDLVFGRVVVIDLRHSILVVHFELIHHKGMLSGEYFDENVLLLFG